MAPLSLPTHSCQDCRRLVISLNQIADGGIPFMTLHKLRLAEDRGCKFSTCILDVAWDFDTPKGVLSGYDNAPMSEYMDYMTLREFSQQTSAFDDSMVYLALVFNSGGILNEIGFGLASSRLYPGSSGYSIARLMPYAEESSPAVQHIHNRPIEGNAGSDQNIERMRVWLGTCLSSHPNCQAAQENSIAPTRLIRIHVEDGILAPRLQHTKGLSLPYVALSYCWGGDQKLKCTSRNLNTLSQSIPIDGLPSTLRDAVNICHRLGVQHLWVDALCIVQDDDDAKQGEIAQMTRVYRNALFTISASSSEAAKDGFLFDRKPPFQGECVYELPYRDENGTIGSITLGHFDGVIQPAPIDLRGWTLQERLLSPRMLDFRPFQLRWICQTDLRGKQLTDGYTDNNRELPEDEFFLPRRFLSSDNQHQGATPELHRCWNNTVGEFTVRSLTVAEDRVFAISGIAEQYATLLRDNYLAGVWMSLFPICLLWQKTDIPGKSRNVISRPKSYQGPTWSWLCLNSPVRLDQATREHKTPHCQLFKAEITLANEKAPFGALKKGSLLKLKGRLLEGTRIRPTLCYLRGQAISTPENGTGPIRYTRRSTVMYLDSRRDEEDYANGTNVLLEIYSDEEIFTVPLKPQAGTPQALRRPNQRRRPSRTLEDLLLTRWEVSGLILRPLSVDQRNFARMGMFRLITSVTQEVNMLNEEEVEVLWRDIGLSFDPFREEQAEVVTLV